MIMILYDLLLKCVITIVDQFFCFCSTLTTWPIVHWEIIHSHGAAFHTLQPHFGPGSQGLHRNLYQYKLQQNTLPVLVGTRRPGMEKSLLFYPWARSVLTLEVLWFGLSEIFIQLHLNDSFLSISL